MFRPMQAKFEFNFTLNTQNMNKETVYLYAYKNVFINLTKTKESLKIDHRERRHRHTTNQQKKAATTTNYTDTSQRTKSNEPTTHSMAHTVWARIYELRKSHDHFELVEMIGGDFIRWFP